MHAADDPGIVNAGDGANGRQRIGRFCFQTKPGS
jgi:hypothetical protein